MPTVNRNGRMIHGVPRGLLGKVSRLGTAAQVSMLCLLAAAAVLLELL